MSTNLFNQLLNDEKNKKNSENEKLEKEMELQELSSENREINIIKQHEKLHKPAPLEDDDKPKLAKKEKKGKEKWPAFLYKMDMSTRTEWMKNNSVASNVHPLDTINSEGLVNSAVTQVFAILNLLSVSLNSNYGAVILKHKDKYAALIDRIMIKHGLIFAVSAESELLMLTATDLLSSDILPRIFKGRDPATTPPKINIDSKKNYYSDDIL